MFLNTSLLREKFTIEDATKPDAHVAARGNRILLPLRMPGGEQERLVIRAHSMHVALRLAAELLKDFLKGGPLLNRPKPYDWKKTWFDVTSDFERPHVPETWCSIYQNGRVVYSHGEYHPFLDVIEQCDVKNRAEYDRAVHLAEDVFQQAGKQVSIHHDINIAVVIGVLEDQARCGLILRAPRRTTTFNLHIQNRPQPEEDDDGNPYILEPFHGLDIAADYLEAIQLSVMVGFIERQIHDGHLRETSDEARKSKAAYNRIGRLTQSVRMFENLFDIRYRPEKPDFKDLVSEAREMNMNKRI